ncbi:glycosyltransferase family 2 protein [Flavobacterium johnsoniae]|uniref:Glycosyltransferase involved in cell wall bisynthesis n=1 Tax=Flavobacterium johnsoniae TaxID=986 RepID=A0A1M5L5A3_FLAJO|nr:glycosyltransferase family 2 protein [Flavobacterium johnsoniae]SHG59959.1 Glycosyltransferase involved in cell wall bisynthesis [Flavobacterium johnsoniae]
MIKKTILSICIPTYNRGEKVFELINSILKYKGDEIEVIVVDNLSTDNTNVLLNQITDSRFINIRNKENIGGIKNIFKALTVSNGEYCFLCLDKDRVDYQKIGDLIERLKDNSDILFGYSKLNHFEESSDQVYDKGFPSVYNMAYLSSHPTGMFYKSDVLRSLPILSQIFNENKKFGFYNDLINAEMAVLGRSKIINLPAFYTETKEECGKVTSFTYINENEVFFFPSKRIEEFLIYSKSLYSLNITKKEKNKVLATIFSRGLIASTLGFRNILKDQSVCNHYLVQSRDVTLIEIIQINFKFLKAFFKSDLPVSIFCKIYISTIANAKILYIMARNK